MTRGRRPLITLKEANDIATKRGQVMEIFSARSDHFHLILFTGSLTTFVKIKRTRAKTSDTAGILHDYQREIRHLTRVPQTPVSAREFWVRSPKGSWQFFRVGKDHVAEIQQDGSGLPGTGFLPGISGAPVSGTLPAGDTRPEKASSKG
ncbi:MAG: hypothetical protein ABFC78_03220 [Methanoregula sp.]